MDHRLTQGLNLTPAMRKRVELELANYFGTTVWNQSADPRPGRVDGEYRQPTEDISKTQRPVGVSAQK